MVEKNWYYNTQTGKVEHGKHSDWTHRIGPYATELEAREALHRAQERNEAWQEQDDDWNDEDD